MMTEPNWDEIYSLAKRAEEIAADGKMDRDTWRCLLQEAVIASNGRPDLTSFLAGYAKAEWTRELREEERGRKTPAA
ncbi:MAG TPA: hypothetical protein VGZ73_28950 [Bryobacteraceae bacterium]|jgi:hypothetical protein|nr:hypothetical protein [Bryobacteraceae bacterium]